MRGETQDLLYLPVPVGPTVRAGKLSKLVRDLLSLISSAEKSRLLLMRKSSVPQSR